jgi:hypothetical protein
MRLVLTTDGVLRYNELTFFSHSMGGLVTRAFIIKYRDVVPKIRRQDFFATPTAGSPTSSSPASSSATHRSISSTQCNQTITWGHFRAIGWRHNSDSNLIAPEKHNRSTVRSSSRSKAILTSAPNDSTRIG